MSAFGQGEPFRVGVEDEMFLVDGDLRLAHVAEEFVPVPDVPDGESGFEAFASEVELRSPPSATAPDAIDALRRHRAALIAAGATPLAAGLHPAAEHGDTRLVDQERYRRVGADMRGLFERTPECAMHVHVGMPDADTAIRVCNGLRTHLPLLAGLAANSPYWFGTDSGMASARASLVRAYPGRGVPRVFRDFADYEHMLETTLRAAGMRDRTHLWWDVRPHPRLGTVEVREMDSQTSLRDTLALAALVHCLARHEVERGLSIELPSAALAWSSFRAARDGVDAEILDEDGRVRPLREVAATMLSRLVGVAGELDCVDALEEVWRIVDEGGGATRQRVAFARGGMDGLLRALVQETAAAA
ncbi:MAG: YbdK family carboxylate-amine ligase [Actinobacteria bacterium]|nr:MAG: YbdK family carboxylate-amine ligase [Actinomycetota bacterium]